MQSIAHSLFKCCKHANILNLLENIYTCYILIEFEVCDIVEIFSETLEATCEIAVVCVSPEKS